MNGLVLFLVIYISLIILLAYVMICGNNKLHRKGIIGKMYRFLAEGLPQLFSRFSKYLPSRCQCNSREEMLGINGKFRYFIAGFFYFIYMFFSLSYILVCYPKVNQVFPDHPLLHQILAFIVLPGPWIIFLIFLKVDPGVITAENVNGYLELYPYDMVIYGPALCPTEHIPIVPRSRYDRYTKRRIALYDHYCPWVLSVVGERTHRWFLLFLLTCIIAAGYYAFADYSYLVYISATKFAQYPKDVGFFQRTFIRIMYCMSHSPFIGGSCFGLIVISLVLFFFLGQQCYYISINLTQVELDKYEIARDYFKQKGTEKKVVNAYDKGFWANWKQCLFPPKVPKCEPYKLKD